MEESLLQLFATNWPAILIMAIMILWFTKQIDKKDLQNQANLDRFINLIEKTNAVMDKVIADISSHNLLLRDTCSDIKELNKKKR